MHFFETECFVNTLIEQTVVFFDRLTIAQCVNHNQNNRSVAAHHCEKTGPILPLLLEWILVQAGRQAGRLKQAGAQNMGGF